MDCPPAAGLRPEPHAHASSPGSWGNLFTHRPQDPGEICSLVHLMSEKLQPGETTELVFNDRMRYLPAKL